MMSLIHIGKSIPKLSLVNKSLYIKNSNVYLNRLNLQIPSITTSYLKYCTSNEKNSKCIYNGALTPKIKAVKFISLSSSIFGIFAQPMLYNEASIFGGAILITCMSICGFFTFVTPILLHQVTKNYVTELFYNEDKDEYCAVTYNFFLRKKLIPFKVEDVHIPDIPGMFTSFLVKGKPVFVESNHFSQTTHYGKIMGYDKPFNFRLNENADDKSSKST